MIVAFTGRTWGVRIERQFLDWANADGMFPTAVQGAVDEIRAGPRIYEFPLPNSLPAGPGELLQIRGWIKSQDTLINPITVHLISKKNSSEELALVTSNQDRNDIVSFYADSLLSRSGYLASVRLPEDFPIGQYRISVECRGASWSHYEPFTLIDGVSKDIVGALETENLHKDQRQSISSHGNESQAEKVISEKISLGTPPKKKTRLKQNGVVGNRKSDDGTTPR